MILIHYYVLINKNNMICPMYYINLLQVYLNILSKGFLFEKLNIKFINKKNIKLYSKIFLKSFSSTISKKIVNSSKKKEVLSPEINTAKKYKEKKIDNLIKFFFKSNLHNIHNIKINGNILNKKLPKINSFPKKLDALY